MSLDRFLEAQVLVYPRVLEELAEGRKRSHWMWFIFPQHISLCQSPTSRYYGITSEEEARAYLEHPVLGPRLIECMRLVRNHLELGDSLEDIFGEVDAMKYRSCMELFSRIDPEFQGYGQ